MSQMKFPVDDTTECMVGWDPPLGSFFGQVYKIDPDGERIDVTEEGEDGTIFWVGAGPPVIRTVDELVRLLAPHAVMPESVYKELFVIEID